MKNKLILSLGSSILMLAPISTVVSCNDPDATAQDLKDVRAALEAIKSTSSLGPTGNTETSITVEQWDAYGEVTTESDVTPSVLRSLGFVNNLPDEDELHGVTIKYSTKKNASIITFSLKVTKNSSGIQVNYYIARPSTLSDEEKTEIDVELFSQWNQIEAKTYNEFEDSFLTQDGLNPIFEPLTQEVATGLGFGTLPTLVHNSTLWYNLRAIDELPSWVERPTGPIPTEAFYMHFGLTIRTKIGTTFSDSTEKTLRTKYSMQEENAMMLTELLTATVEQGIPAVYVPFGTTEQQVDSALLIDAFKYMDEEMNPLEYLTLIGYEIYVRYINTTAKTFTLSIGHDSFESNIDVNGLKYEVATLAKSVEMETARIYTLGWYNPMVLPSGSVLENGADLTSGQSFNIIKEAFKLNNPLFDYSVTITNASATQATVTITFVAKADATFNGEADEMTVRIAVA